MHNNWNPDTLPLGFFTIPNLKVLRLGSNLDVLDMAKCELTGGLGGSSPAGREFPMISIFGRAINVDEVEDS